MSDFTPEATLWFVANSLVKEDDYEAHGHVGHEAYAAALIMQDLISRLYPEPLVLPFPRQPLEQQKLKEKIEWTA